MSHQQSRIGWSVHARPDHIQGVSGVVHDRIAVFVAWRD
jgi:hypothetical protein